MQDDFLREHALQIRACESFADGNGTASASSVDAYRNNFTSVHHLLCQLNSVAAVTRLWRAAGTAYDAVVYLRPDVYFNCPFPVDVLETLADNTVYVPDFHHWGGLNDRFAMGKPRVVEHWGERCASKP